MKTYQIAIIIAVAVAAWMLSGSLASAPSSDETHSLQIQAKTDTEVRVQNFKQQEKTLTLRLQGHSKAKRIVDVNSQISGTVINTPVEKGERVNKGDVLCQLAKEDRPAQVLKEKASVEQAELDYKGAKKLFDQGLISASDLASKKAILKSHLAMLEIAQINVERLNIRAPFTGFVEQRPAEIGQLMQRGQTCARLIDESELLATARATQKELSQLQLGQLATVVLANGQSLKGEVSFIGQEADPTTRTFAIEVTLKHKTPVASGITSKIIIPTATVKAQHIPSSILALNKQQQLVVREIDSKHIVRFTPVEVVAEDSQGIWVTGLNVDATLIVVGQELVSPGEKVKTTFVNNKG